MELGEAISNSLDVKIFTRNDALITALSSGGGAALFGVSIALSIPATAGLVVVAGALGAGIYLTIKSRWQYA